MARTTKADLAAQAQHAFCRAVAALGHQAAVAPRDAAWDVAVTVDGIELHVALKAAAVVTPETAQRMIASVDKRRTSVVNVAVGDLVTGPARQALPDAGWGWLDRRGHLVLRGRGVHIDADVAADPRATDGPRTTIAGVAAISWAAALLLSPTAPPPMREVARRVSISHSAVVAASKRLRAASLVRADGRPLIPELFWALAEQWRPNRVALADLPPLGDAGAYGDLGVGLADDGPGWALAGTVGAVAWGAPMTIGSGYPPDFYVPSPTVLRQATLRLGAVSRFDDRACTVAVAPTPLVCGERRDRASSEWGHWRFAHGLFAALDLAEDRARGAEVLGDWNPKDFTRVW